MRILRPIFAVVFLSSCVAGTLAVGTDVSMGDDDDDAVSDDDDGDTDTDGDGDPDVTDCDDQDPEVATTLDEVCGDGKDNDCDPATNCHVFRKDGNEVFVEPVPGDESAAEFYGYGTDVAGAHGFEVSNALAMFLYRDPRSDLWLILSADSWNDGSGGSLLLDLVDIGGAGLEVIDDDGEGVPFDGGLSFEFEWFNCCPDGAVVGPLDDDFCISAEAFTAEGLDAGVVTYDGFDLLPVGSVEGRTEICLEN